ncbi:hypothetical protein [Flavobacterium sp. 3HN19-14]|uniref:hypothetical protein n=1 Tax=Flavobacterium sp. 3HN19-14 TaxID=3448133 RepID=UPI003EE358F1
MRLFLSGLLLWLCGCSSKHVEKNVAEIPQPDSVAVSHIDVEKILNDYALRASEFAKSDSLFYPVGRYMEEDTSRIIVIGKFIDKEKIYAVDISSQMNATVSFYQLNDKKWQKIGSHKTPNDIFQVAFKDYDGDGKNEIITQGHYNINGNFWNEFYHFSPGNNTIIYAGSFFAGAEEYVIGNNGKTLKVEYSGSCHGEETRTFFEWCNGQLIRRKQIVLSEIGEDCIAKTIEYYENPTSDKDTLVRRFKKRFRGKQYDFWDNFFLNN